MVKIFVGNLSGDVSSQDLRELFDQFGDINDCEKLDNKQFGFVHMAEEDSANMAVRKLHKTSFKGSRINVEISASKPQKLFVGNLSSRTTSEDLRELFESAGAKVVQAENCEGKKFGFVRIETSKGFKEVHQLVRRLNGSNFNGNSIVVELSEDKSLEEKKRQRDEKEHGYGLTNHRGAPSYQPYHTPFSSGNPRWGPENHFDDFPVDTWAPGNQRGHVNKMRGFGRGGYSGLGFGGDYESPGLGNDYGRPALGGGYAGLEPPAAAARQQTADPDTAELLQSKYRSRMFTRNAAANLQLLETGQFADYQIECEGTTFQVHRMMVAARSPVLMRIISTTHSPLVVSDVDSRTMHALLQFIYTGNVDVEDISPASIVKLLSAADLYQVEMVKEGLESALVENISVDTAVDYLIVSEELQLVDLKRVVNQFICSRAKVMKERTDFKTKLAQYPHLIMELFDAASH